MKIDKQALSSALRMVAPVINNNPIIPALAGVKITDKYITGGNSQVSVAVPVALGIPESVLDFSILSKAVFGLTGEIDLTFKGEVAVLKSHEGKVQVPVIGQFSEYPEMKHEFLHDPFVLTREDIASISQLSNFTHSDGMPCFAGILYDGELFSAYDKIAFGLYNKPTGFGKEAIFPKDLFRALSNIPADTYDFVKGFVTAKAEGKVVAYVKYLLHNENFPQVQQLISSLTFDKTSTISQQSLGKAFDLLAISTDEATRIIELHFDHDNGITGITGKEEINTLSEIGIDSTNEGVDDKFAIGFNIDRLGKSLKFIGGNDVKLQLSTPTKPAMVRSDVEGRKVIIAPVALNAAQ